MKKITIVGILACSVFLVGCGEEKTADQVQYERQKEMRQMELMHQREMARIEAKKIQAQNPVSHTYVENEYDQRSYQQDNYQEQPQYGSTQSQMGSQAQEVQPQSYASAQEYATPATASAPVQQPTDEGFGVGSMALAALGGAAAGYFAGEMLNNGYKSYKDDHGNTHYTDRDGRPVSKTAYEDHKKKNPKTTAFREKASDLKAKTVAGATAVKDKAVATKDKVVNSDRMQQMKQQAVADKEKVQQNQKYQQSKTYTQDTSKAVQQKMNSRIPPAQQKATAKPAPRPQPAKRPSTSRPSGKRR